VHDARTIFVHPPVANPSFDFNRARAFNEDSERQQRGAAPAYA